MAAYGFAPRSPTSYFGGGNSVGQMLGGLDQAILGGIDTGIGVSTGLRNFDYGNIMADYALPAGMAHLTQQRLASLYGAMGMQGRLGGYARMVQNEGEAATANTQTLAQTEQQTPLDLMGIARDIGTSAASPSDPLGTSGMSHTARMLNLFPYTYRSPLY